MDFFFCSWSRECKNYGAELLFFMPETHFRTDRPGFLPPARRSTRFLVKQSKNSLIFGDFLVKNDVPRSHRAAKAVFFVRKCFVPGLKSNPASKSFLFSSKIQKLNDFSAKNHLNQAKWPKISHIFFHNFFSRKDFSKKLVLLNWK